MPRRTFAVAAAVVGAAVLATTGITYASSVGSTTRTAPSDRRASPPVHRAPAPVLRAAPAVPPAGRTGASEGRDGDRDRNREGRDHGYDHRYVGRIYFNDRSYSAYVDGCVTVADGLGSNSFNVFNDSKKTVEVFRGFTCDNGAPVATVGPHGSGFGVVPGTVRGGGFFLNDGVVGSFRVIGHYDEW